MSVKLFLIVGQPGQGKTTLSTWIQRLLGCAVIHTDECYVEWLIKTFPELYSSRRAYIRRKILSHYTTLPNSLRRTWNEYITNLILEKLEKMPWGLVLEGWLMLFLPDDLKAKIVEKVKLLEIRMKRYVAHVEGEQIRPDNRDYTNVVNTLCRLMIAEPVIK